MPIKYDGYAGDRMTITEDAEGTATFSFDDKGTGRVCGSCQLCCKLVPVPVLYKPAGQRCRHSRVGKGCTIYRNRPDDCRSWSCRWIADAATAGMPRPDRCHYVIDLAYDYVTMMTPDGSPARRFTVMQIWVDPAFPNVHRAPELREYMQRRAAQDHVATIIRFTSRHALTIFPPAFNENGEWLEIEDGIVVPRTAEERAIMNGWGGVDVTLVP